MVSRFTLQPPRGVLSATSPSEPASTSGQHHAFPPAMHGLLNHLISYVLPPRLLCIASAAPGGKEEQSATPACQCNSSRRCHCSDLNHRCVGRDMISSSSSFTSQYRLN